MKIGFSVAQCVRIAISSLFVFSSTAFAASSAARWPQFRGPGSLGVEENPNLP